MKKTSFLYLILIMQFAIVSSLWAAPAAKALLVQGDVKYRSGASEWKSLATGDTVSAGSQINTGPSSSVDLGIGEKVGSAVKVDADSHVAIASLDKEGANMSLETGRVVSIVKELPDGSVFQVQSPSVSLSAPAGSGFSLSTNSVEVYEGNPLKVETASGASATVEPGKGLSIAADGSFGEVYEVKDKSGYEDFSGQIHDYRWAIPGTAEYNAGPAQSGGTAASSTTEAAAGKAEEKPKSASVDASAKESSTKKEEVSQDKEVEQEKPKEEPKNIPVPDQEGAL